MSVARPLFAAEGFGKRFGGKRVLKSASVWGQAGRITVLLGRNGSGKSTLFRCALGLIAADHGVVHFDGTSWMKPALADLARRGVMFLPAEGALVRGRTLGEQMDAYGWRFRSGASVSGIAERLRLADALDRPTDELSGGELRRAAIAVALARQPRCLIADEPFAGASPRDAEAMKEGLLELAATGCAIIVSGHEVPTLLEVADDVVWMAAGTTHGIGSPVEARAHEQFRREYLGPVSPR